MAAMSGAIDDLDPSTLAVVLGRVRTPGGPVGPPVELTSTYHADGPFVYGRDENRTWAAFEEALGGLEGGRALTFASGMAAVAAVVESLPVGAVVVAPADAYKGTRGLLGELAAAGRLQLRSVDVTDAAATIAAADGADLVWLESPTNPSLGICDLAAVAAGARDAGATVVVDNTFATPLLQRPLDLGADVVVHSATKFLAGHSDVVLGATVTRDGEWYDRLLRRRSAHGGIGGPFETWLALRGLRTLAVRLERAQTTAALLATRLAAHPAVERVRYPGLPDHPGHDVARRQMRGFGAMLSFDVRGGAEPAEAVAQAVRLIVHATSLGGVETMVERRSRWRGEETTPPGLVRMSVGLEDVDDLWRDLDQALRAATGEG